MHKLHKLLINKMQKEKIPTEFIGLISNKDGSPKFFEIVIKRPHRYNYPELMKKNS